MCSTTVIKCSTGQVVCKRNVVLILEEILGQKTKLHLGDIAGKGRDLLLLDRLCYGVQLQYLENSVCVRGAGICASNALPEYRKATQGSSI